METPVTVLQAVTVEQVEWLLVLTEVAVTAETQAMAEMEVMPERRTIAL